MCELEIVNKSTPGEPEDELSPVPIPAALPPPIATRSEFEIESVPINEMVPHAVPISDLNSSKKADCDD
jgi:hypothetical protein